MSRFKALGFFRLITARLVGRSPGARGVTGKHREAPVVQLSFGRLRSLLVLAFVAVAAGCGGDSDSENLGRTQAALITDLVTVRLLTPPAMSPREMALAAKYALQVGGGSSVVDTAGHGAPVSNAGKLLAFADIGGFSRIGSLWARSPVTLHTGARVEGSVFSESWVLKALGVVVTGTIQQNTPLDPFIETKWTVKFEHNPFNNALVLLGQTRDLAAGSYGSVRVKAGGRLKLGAGTYFIESLALEPGSVLELPTAGAATAVYVSSTLTFGAAYSDAGQKNLIVVYLGVLPALVTSSFRGALVAPNAELELGWTPNGHQGSFFGKHIDLAAGTKVTLVPFDWMQVVPPVVSTRVDAPVILTSSRNVDGSGADDQKTPSAPVPFKVPTKLRVSKGNAGNGTAILEFVSGGALVQCTYRGGSSRPDPETDFDRAKGRFYNFVSCSNGLSAGGSAVGSRFNLRIVSGATNHPFKRVVVKAHLGDGCSELLDAPIPPEETVRLRQAFSWRNTSQIATVDPEGLPSMRYALIYVEDQRQLESLDKMKIYYRKRPIFPSELARYKGKCGMFDYSGEGWGMFVHAIIPGTVYNFLRQVALTVLDRQQGGIPFRAIYLPPVPDDGFAHPDGSLKWQKFKESGFVYFDQAQDGRRPFPRPPDALFGIDIPIVDDAIELVESAPGAVVDAISGVPVAGELVGGFVQLGNTAVATAMSIVPSEDEIIETVFNLGESAWEAGTDLVGEIEKFFFGSVHVSIDLTVLNRDPAFGTTTALARAWGSAGGREIAPEGARVDVLKWSTVIIPSSFYGTLDTLGRTRLEMAKGGSARGESGICVKLDNRAGIVSSGITENEFCDFGDLSFFGFDRDTAHDLRVNDYELHALTQVTDAYNYAVDVLRHTPPQAEIGTGVMGIFRDGAWAPCFNFPGVFKEIDVAVLTTGPLAWVAAPMAKRDIFLPDEGNAINSRGIPTHEYGHFLMCSIMFNTSLPALQFLYPNRIFEGDADAESDEIALIMESWADIIASQVVSGTNYAVPSVSFFSNNMSFCTTAPCIEGNFRGTRDSGSTQAFNDEVARTVSLVHDVLDRPTNVWRASNQTPTNADAWVVSPTGVLSFTPTGYLLDVDDAVSLDGNVLERWLQKALLSAPITHSLPMLRPNAIFESLADTLYDSGVSWCNACVLFSQHDPSPIAVAAAAPGALFPSAHWNACTTVGSLNTILGPPPEASLNLDATTCTPCPAWQISVNGVCTLCAAGQIAVNNTCFTCPPGTENVLRVGGSTIPVNSCLPCPDHEVSVGGLCVACPPATIADRATNTCVECASNMIADFATGADFCFWSISLGGTALPSSDPNSCDMYTLLEINNLDSALAFPYQEVIFDVLSRANTQAECEGTTFASALQVRSGSAWTTLADSVGFTIGRWEPPPPCTPPNCLFVEPPCRFDLSFTLSRAEIESGRTRARVVLQPVLNPVDFTLNVSPTPPEARPFPENCIPR